MNNGMPGKMTERPPIVPALKGVVADLLREGSDRFILPRFQNLSSHDIATKSSKTDFVTIADQETEAWLIPRLFEAQPGFVIGEEAAATLPRIRNQIPTGYSWTIDPLDGTKNFVRGKTAFCSMVSLLWNGQPIECWIWQPLVKILFYASDHSGAFRIDEFSETRLRIAERPFEVDLMCGSGNSLGLAEPKKDLFQSRLRGLAGRRFPGSAGIQACLIANGEEDYLIHGNSTPWDHAPVDLLCRMAGGYAGMLDGQERFHASMAGPFMAASSYQGWKALKKVVW
ncbi:MAG: inositol monophosphatase family protein [Candidatus Puniceispirillaceae bacterium]